MLLPVIIAGGSGTRLWPLSRTLFPKQFLSLHSQQSLLQETVGRLQGLPCAEPLIICNECHRFLVAEQMREIEQPCSILLEPVGRNTAPAIALAALHASSGNETVPLLLVLPADHVIENVAAFQQVVLQAVPFARDGVLVMFGIVPTVPTTDYGYIKKSSAVRVQTSESFADAAGLFGVAQFVEKPDLATAAALVESGDYLWNSGMFLFRADRYLSELGLYRPDIAAACEAAMSSRREDMDFTRVDSEAFAACPADSIDYAVMEKTRDAVVVPLDAGWSDVGSWSALWSLGDKDEQGNSFRGDVLIEDTQGCLVHAEDRLVATLGLKDTVIVETADGILVASRDRVQDVKRIVDRLKADDRPEYKHHRAVFRPWGHFDSIDQGRRYQVKRLVVKPGAKLSVQMHHHRAEHWVVVTGTARVTNGERSFLVTENESTYIPIGNVHSLENPGKIPLELIEVQSGAYLGEDDIVRFDDRYGRETKCN